MLYDYIAWRKILDALDERITNTAHPMDLIFDRGSKVDSTDYSARELVLKYKTRVYGILHGGYNVLIDTKPCSYVTVDGRVIHSKPLKSKYVFLIQT